MSNIKFLPQLISTAKKLLNGFKFMFQILRYQMNYKDQKRIKELSSNKVELTK